MALIGNSFGCVRSRMKILGIINNLLPMLINIYRFVYSSIDLIGKTNITNLANNSNIVDNFTHLKITCFCDEAIKNLIEMMPVSENWTCFVIESIFH